MFLRLIFLQNDLHYAILLSAPLVGMIFDITSLGKQKENRVYVWRQKTQDPYVPKE